MQKSEEWDYIKLKTIEIEIKQSVNKEKTYRVEEIIFQLLFCQGLIWKPLKKKLINNRQMIWME